jgi:membrane protease YdiL (CAAX protease family)
MKNQETNIGKSDARKTIHEILWFVAIALPLTYAIGIYIWNKGGLGNAISMATMYVPALTVIGLYLFKFKKPLIKNGDLGINLKGLKYWIVAPLFLSGLSFLSFGVSYFFNPEMFETAESIKTSLMDQGYYFGNIYVGLFVIFILNGLIGSLFNIPMFIGEELGWRAFLVPRLLKILSPQKAFLVGATIWALWHAVMIAEGLNYPSIHPILGVLLMIVFCFPVGIIFQYLYKKSNSVFFAALAHAALNKSGMTMSFLLAGDSYNTLLYGPTGIIGIVIFGIVAYVLYNKIEWTEGK